MTVVVNTRDEQEEKTLLAFLDSQKYEYLTSNGAAPTLTDAQAEEVLSRDEKFVKGETSSRPWSEIKHELTNVYR